jgi:nitroreductase
MSHDSIAHILDLARWAPSGDNTQPWRFEVVSDQHIRVHGHDTRDHILYDYDGHPSHIAHGALLETLRIAASGFGLRADWTVSSANAHRTPVYDVLLARDLAVQRDPLFDFIEQRTVQRRPMQTTVLTTPQRQALAQAVGDGFKLQLFESAYQRRQVAKLLWDSAKIRLTCPEAFPVHKSIIEWGARFSKDRIPEEAVGVDPITARLMRWVMHSWSRVDFFNRYLAGTIAPRIQLDLLPGLRCAAHVLVRPAQPPTQLEDWIRLGMTVQRLWLTVTQLGLHLQPQMTPVIFRCSRPI